MTHPYIDAFIHGYITCALWSSTSESGDPMDSLYSPNDISPEALAQMREDCEDFVEGNSDDLNAYIEARKGSYDVFSGRSEQAAHSAGHDFWLTRNGHGAGFWDRGLGDLGERLTRAAKVYSTCDIYEGDDGSIHIQ